MSGALFVGDLILGEPDPHWYLEPGRELLGGADLVVGNVEVPHTRRGQRQDTPVPAVPAPPEHLAALRWAGFHAATLANNHIFDLGADGLLDTRAGLLANRIAPAGAGADAGQARQPAIVRAGGRTWGILAYNCVGPILSWAAADRAGCAYIGLLAPDGSRLDDPGAASADAVGLRPDAADIAAMNGDIAALRSQVDMVVVALHKGVVHTPAVVLPYEREIAHAAIDGGADVVAAHHAHILRGIEIHRGKPIFHGLGNWVTVTRALTPGQQDDAGREEWARTRLARFGFRPDPELPSTYPFHPESRNTIAGVLDIVEDGVMRAGFVPCWIDEGARPVPCDPAGERGAAVVEYVRAITARAGFGTNFTVLPGDPIVWTT